MGVTEQTERVVQSANQWHLIRSQFLSNSSGPSKEKKANFELIVVHEIFITLGSIPSGSLSATYSSLVKG